MWSACRQRPALQRLAHHLPSSAGSRRSAPAVRSRAVAAAAAAALTSPASTACNPFVLKHNSDGVCTAEALTVCTHVEGQTYCVRSRNSSTSREQQPKEHLTPAAAVAAAVAARAAAVATRAAAAARAEPADATRLGATGRLGLCRLQALPGAGAAACAATSAGSGAWSSAGGRRAGAGLVGSLAMGRNPGSALRRPGGRPRRLGCGRAADSAAPTACAGSLRSPPAWEQQ